LQQLLSWNRVGDRKRAVEIELLVGKGRNSRGVLRKRVRLGRWD
jgi:hypothetical protein